MIVSRIALIFALLISWRAAVADQIQFDADIAGLQAEFNVINAGATTSTDDQQAKGFERLRAHAEEVSNRYNKRPEPLVWQAWALCEYAMAVKNFSAMKAYQEAREKLEHALELNPKVFNGKPWITLARLYHHLPSWPISYGSKRKAREYYRKGLNIDPFDCEANYFFAELLVDDDEDYNEALRYLGIAARTQQLKSMELAYMKPLIDNLMAKIAAKNNAG